MEDLTHSDLDVEIARGVATGHLHPMTKKTLGLPAEGWENSIVCPLPVSFISLISASAVEQTSPWLVIQTEASHTGKIKIYQILLFSAIQVAISVTTRRHREDHQTRRRERKYPDNPRKALEISVSGETFLYRRRKRGAPGRKTCSKVSWRGR